MAAIHVLDKTNGEYRVVIHVAIPATNNSSAVNWRTALINSGKGGTTILKDGDGTAGTISAAEKATIVSGAVLEIVANVRAESVASGAAALNAYLDAEVTRITNAELARLQAELKYYGATR